MTEQETRADHEFADLQTSEDIGTYAESLLDSSSTVHIEHDDALKDLGIKDSDSLSRHSENYDDILKNYTNHVSETLKSKRNMKLAFFIVALSTMGLTVLSIAACVIIIAINAQNESFDVQDYIVPVVSALVSFLTTFIVIPKIIAEYLFNSNEDSVMKDIVSSIQDYDKFIRNDLHKSSSDSDDHR